MRDILNQLFNHQKLTRQQARDILVRIGEGFYKEVEIAAFISVYLMRNISVEELEGFRDALLELCVKTDMGDIDTIDMCGTGGDGKNTFNISTVSSFVVAGAGYPVSKHGNYGVSSLSGSSSVLEYFGCSFSSDSDQLRRQLDKTNYCYLHAPLFHPVLRVVGPTRRDLGVKTFFNMLGPLVNPVQPKYQSVGVFSLKLARLYKYLFEKTQKQFAVIYSLDGFDEISLTGDFKVITPTAEKLIKPVDIGFSRWCTEDLFGGNSVKDAAEIFINVLKNNGTMAQKEVVLANSAIAIHCFNPEKSMAECIEEARESLESGLGFSTFKKFIEL